MFKGENLLELEPENRSLAGLFMSFQSPVEIPGVSNIDFLNMAYNARRRKFGLPELGPIEVQILHPCSLPENSLFLTITLYTILAFVPHNTDLHNLKLYFPIKPTIIIATHNPYNE